MSTFLPIGTILDNNYRILEIIGQGGFGITYKVENISLGNIVCIKELFISGNSTRGLNNTVHSQNMKENSFNYFKERFISEARDLAKFNNPGIVKVTRVFEQNDTAYFVMDFIEGETLKSYISKNGRLTFKNALPIVEGLMNALEYIHNNSMLHRDIKPDNVIIDKNGNIVLIDFGSARQFTEGYTVTHTSMITPGYAPLEQYDDRAKRGAFTDIYSLGATIYFLLTGQKPIPATSRNTEVLPAPHNLFADISVTLSSAVMLAMNLNPRDRFQTIAELREALQNPKVELPPKPPSWVRNVKDSRVKVYFLMVLLIISAVSLGVKSNRINILRIAKFEIKKIEKIVGISSSKERSKSHKQLKTKHKSKLKTQAREGNNVIADGIKEAAKK